MSSPSDAFSPRTLHFLTDQKEHCKTNSLLEGPKNLSSEAERFILILGITRGQDKQSQVSDAFLISRPKQSKYALNSPN